MVLKRQHMNQLKAQIHQICVQQIKERVQNLAQRLQIINESKANETKSSVGDKYETGRAMLQIDEDKVLTQLQFNRDLQSQLDQIKLDYKTDRVQKGSLVETEKGLYFVGIGLGKITAGAQLCYCVSLQSPVGKALIGKSVGEVVTTNQLEMTILNLY